MVDPFTEDAWKQYLSTRREQYMVDRARGIGPEYQQSKQQWDGIFEQEWTVMEERLNAGIGLDTIDELRIKNQFGEDFFEKQMNELIAAEVHQVATEFEEVDIGDGKLLPYVYYEDFMMLSNQGIFRLEEFLLDKSRKWEKKIMEDIGAYGYQKVGYVEIFEEVVLHVTRAT